MGIKTSNYNLNKPYEADVFDLKLFNENADITDKELNALDKRTNTLESDVTTLNAFSAVKANSVVGTVKTDLLKGKVITNDVISGSTVTIPIPFSKYFKEIPYPYVSVKGSPTVIATVKDVSTTMLYVDLTDVNFSSAKTITIYWHALGEFTE